MTLFWDKNYFIVWIPFENFVHFIISYLLSYLSLNILWFEYFLNPVKMGDFGEGIHYSEAFILFCIILIMTVFIKSMFI